MRIHTLVIMLVLKTKVVAMSIFLLHSFTYCTDDIHIRPVGSKFEMVRPYYSAMHAHNFLGHAHLPSPSPATRYPSSRVLLFSNCFLGRFEAVVAES